MKDTFHFCAISKITLEHEQGTPTSQLKSTDLRLEVSGNLDKTIYIDGKGLPRKDALKPISIALLHGIFVNIKMGHDKGWWNEAEHMKYIIDQLQRVYISTSPGNPGISTMEY